MSRVSSFSAALGLAAALSMAAAPASAAELPAAQSRAHGYANHVSPADAVTAHGWRRHRDHDRVDAGDVIAGVLLIGGIAAIASAASNSSRKRADRDDRYRDDYRYRSSDDSAQYRRSSRSDAGSGIDNAVNQCVSAIERDVRVASVDGVDRNAAGWLVTGTIYNGDGFSCRIDGAGRIDGIDFGRGAAAVPYSGAASDGQWDDARYRAAWARVDAGNGTSQPVAEQQAQPAYPGGPLPGEQGDD